MSAQAVQLSLSPGGPLYQPVVLDANGRIPAPIRPLEAKIAAMTRNGGMARAMAELMRKQKLPLSEKIDLSKELIRDWYESWDGMVSVSYSGGKDSTVLLWLVRRMYPEVPAVFCHTGLEYPEVVQLVMETPNHVIVRPEMHFFEVVRRFGWPMASKKIARGINILRHPTEKNKNVYRLYDIGINRFGEKVNGFKVPAQWRFLVDAPFNCSDHCCEIMKKRPMKKYGKETKRVCFTGTIATDSKARQRTYLQQGGCNAYDAKTKRSAPLSFWTEQDVLRCISENKLKIPSVYGEILRDNEGRYSTTGVRRTGCVFCCFGLHMDEGRKNRFELLHETHPKMYRLVMEKMGLHGLLQYCRDHAPARLAKTFRWCAQ
jgi:3'-phosphoadenosine 5'-phosphosulfate sulfotransferase (PAPS reductase)/FAD synthetase